jgi:hypothetical protein
MGLSDYGSNALLTQAHEKRLSENLPVSFLCALIWGIVWVVIKKICEA